CQRYNDSPWTF
nr:immunoglobulin light chain junction region [Macaca mulatta]